MSAQLGVVEREIHIDAPPRTVYAFFIDPARMVRWKGKEATLDPRPGGIYRVNVTGKDFARGQYVELVPYSRIVFTWGWEGEGSALAPGTSTVEITLVPDRGGTTLRLRHFNLPQKEVAGHTEGWDHFLPRLQLAAEGKDAGPDPWAA
jgi:uncharacterized protein YndB with AHSA1/START domain